jgi:flagellar basal-body rod protein FlgB
VLDDVTSVALHAALRGLAARSRAVSDNVANIQTPGFLAGRVQFEDTLRQALRSGSSPDVAPAVARSLEPTRENGNNVNLDTETISGVDTGLRYQLTLRAVDDRFKLLTIATKGAV